MGSRQFLTVGRGTTPKDAFWREVVSAISMRGNRGDTGTVAEEYEFVVFDAVPGVRTFDIARWALALNDPDLSDMPPELAPLVASIAKMAGDKREPTVVIWLPPDECLDHVPLEGTSLYLIFGTAPY